MISASFFHFSKRWVLLVVFWGFAFINIQFAFADTIIYSGDYFDILVSDPVDVESSHTLKAVVLTASGQRTNSKPNTFDCTKSGSEPSSLGIFTSGNHLHQVGWLKADVPAAPVDIYTPTNESQFDEVLDTHFLINPPDVIISSPSPQENMPVQDAAFHEHGHYGSYLKGNFALQGLPSELPATWEFARIVVPNGTEINFNFAIGGFAFEGGEYVGKDDKLSVSYVVPEPCTLGLLGMGALALWAYRRLRKR
ncbi:MAG: PEP-CTERM sorting domain-containing protein [Pirellulales bacterium]|nr:PEP-CTERM sorting domain-containing protein [Pirellulales bacterium]